MPALAVLLLLASVPSEPGPTIALLDSREAVQRALKPASRPLLIHFWALWCPPCMEELPRQVSLARRAKEAGADVLFISVDEPEKNPAIRQRLETLGALSVARHAQMDMKVDADAIARLIDNKWDGSLPATFVLSREGRTALSVFGELSAEEERKVLAALKPRRGRGP